MLHANRLLFAALLAAVPFSLSAHSPAEEMAEAAGAWLQALTPPLRARAVFPLDDPERANWHFVPRDRLGVPLKDQSPGQRRLARALVASALSERGRLQVDAIIALEEVLFAIEGKSHRNPELYYFTIFGRPGPDAAWGWRVEGHHLSLNVTVVGAAISATPMFFGSNPAEVRIEHAQKGRRALAAEEDQGRALMRSFSDGQRAAALISPTAPADILTGNDREAKLAAPTGLPYARMNPAQQAALRALVDVYARRLRPELADAALQRIADRGWDQVWFAWAGGLEPGQGHYYRIHGPGFVIECDCTQNEANHIHTAWRDFTGDFGRDLLREHIERDHRP